MPKCTYCGQNYEFPMGTTVVESISGKVRYFCSSKCRKNFEMNRKKKKWANPAKII
jgi:ribosomal protein L24E